MPEVRLHQFAPDDGVESGSPFCAKVHRALAFKGVEYEPVEVAGPGTLKRLNPGALKVPILEWDGELVPDSSRIFLFLDEKVPAAPLVPDDPSLRARAQLLEDWADEALYWLPVYSRWSIDVNFEPFARRAFGSLPIPLRWFVPGMIRRDVEKQLRGQGTGRLAPEAVLERLAAYVDMLEVLLGDSPFLLGDEPTGADIAIFAMLRPLALETAPESAAVVRPRTAIVDYLRRVDGRTSGAHTVAFE